MSRRIRLFAALLFTSFALAAAACADATGPRADCNGTSSNTCATR
jgi:hypothetical protein